MTPEEFKELEAPIVAYKTMINSALSFMDLMSVETMSEDLLRRTVETLRKLVDTDMEMIDMLLKSIKEVLVEEE